MEVSRLESRKRNKQNRKNKRNKLIALNVTLLGIILILVGFLINVWNDDLSNIGSLKPPQSNEEGSSNGAEQGGDRGGSADGGEDGVAVVAPSASPAATPDEGAAGEDGEDTPAVGPGDGTAVSLSFVGDVLLGPYVNDVVKKKGHAYLYEASAAYLNKADITAGNLEAPITKGGIPHEGKDYVYYASPDTLPALKDAGFDLMSLANNHILDHGVVGMRDTIKHLDDIGMAHMGAGENDTEAFAARIIEVNGIKVAYIGVSRVIFNTNMKADKFRPGVAEAYDHTRALKAIEAAKEEADIVVVMPHWGKMGTVVLEKHQTDLGRAFIDAGADLVIGCHPHVLQGFEMYKGKWIAYSLGNFIFGVGPKGQERETAVLDAVCTKNGECELKLHPMYVENAQPKPMEQSEGQLLLERLMAISPGLRFEADGTIKPE